MADPLARAYELHGQVCVGATSAPIAIKEIGDMLKDPRVLARVKEPLRGYLAALVEELPDRRGLARGSNAIVTCEDALGVIQQATYDGGGRMSKASEVLVRLKKIVSESSSVSHVAAVVLESEIERLEAIGNQGGS